MEAELDDGPCLWWCQLPWGNQKWLAGKSHIYRRYYKIFEWTHPFIGDGTSNCTPPWQDLSGSNCMSKPTVACQSPMFSSTGTKDPASNHQCTVKIDLTISDIQKISLGSWIASIHYWHIFGKKSIMTIKVFIWRVCIDFWYPLILVRSQNLETRSIPRFFPGVSFQMAKNHLQMPVQ